MTAEDVYRAPGADLAGRSLAGGAGQLTSNMLESLRKTRPWVLLVGILLLLGAALLLIGTVALVIGAASFSEELAQAGVSIAALSTIYIVLGVIYLFLGIYLVKYARAIRRALDTQEPAEVEAALAAQASFWKIVGIIALIFLVLIVLFLLLIVVGGAAGIFFAASQ